MLYASSYPKDMDGDIRPTTKKLEKVRGFREKIFQVRIGKRETDILNLIYVNIKWTSKE